jgi:esterase/lipase superfamily enzyme
MPKNSWSFVVPPLPAPIGVTRWGHFGMPVVLFASAGGDSLEAERLQIIAALAPLLDAGRIKVYAVDGSAMRLLLAGTAAPAARIEAQRSFAAWVESGLGPHVRRDCENDRLELLACGCALGAASALQALLRNPQLFRGAIGLSGTYDLLPWLAPAWTDGAAAGVDVSPLQGVARLSEGPALVRLRQRPITLASWVIVCEPRCYRWQQCGQLATTTPTVTAMAKITTRISPISHCRRKNFGPRHCRARCNRYPTTHARKNLRHRLRSRAIRQDRRPRRCHRGAHQVPARPWP